VSFSDPEGVKMHSGQRALCCSVLLLHCWGAALLCGKLSALVPDWDWRGYDPFDAHASEVSSTGNSPMNWARNGADRALET